MFQIGMITRPSIGGTERADFSQDLTSASSEGLRPRQAQLLQILYAYWHQHAAWPTLDEMAERLGVAKSTTRYHFGKLIEKGYVVRVHGAKAMWLPGLTSVAQPTDVR